MNINIPKEFRPTERESLDRCVREAVLAWDTVCDYADVKFGFGEFEMPKTIVFKDAKGILHIQMDDVFEGYGPRILIPYILHVLDWYEGREQDMYPRRIIPAMFARPEFLRDYRRKFDRRYRIPPMTWEFDGHLQKALEETVRGLSSRRPAMANFLEGCKVSWRRAHQDSSKVPVADTDVFNNRIFIDPCVADAPERVREYILAHEVAVIKTFDFQNLKPSYDGILKAVKRVAYRKDVAKYMSENGMWFRYEPY